jgi:hypothetical protein
MSLDKLKSFIPINVELVANPVNWVIVFLMIAFAGVGLAFILQDHTTTEENE